MVLRRINNLILIFILICSTSFYELTILGSAQRIIELIGIGLIIFLIVIHTIYDDVKAIPRHFTLPIVLFFLSLVTSTLMAKFSRNQDFEQTIYAQRAIYYYLLYFLLHQMKIRPKDMELIFFGLGILYVFLYLLQFSVYPTRIYDAYVRADRGTIRIYLTGAAYFGIAFYMSVQYFYRTNKLIYFFFTLLFFSIYVLTGGRQMLVIVLFVVSLFLIFDKKVKSKFTLGFLGVVGFTMLLLLFQGIIESILMASERDISKGEDYIRFLAADFFLTDFFKHPFAYFTGNGMFFNSSNYGKEISSIAKNDNFNLGDIGIIGNYAIYGALFVTGIIMILIRSFKLKIESDYSYIKYMMISVLLAIFTAGSFAFSDFICYMTCVLYLLDVSNYNATKVISTEHDLSPQGNGLNKNS